LALQKNLPPNFSTHCPSPRQWGAEAVGIRFRQKTLIFSGITEYNLTFIMR
jgi:hypothetical protein